jgi:hypothetical protein
MPYSLHVIRASEFVCLNAKEQLDFEGSKQALQTLALALQKRGLDRAMLDLRSLPTPPKPLFTPSQLAALVRAFLEAGFGKDQKLAILYRSDPHGGVRTFAFIGRIQGWHVQAFADFEQAFYWLSEEPAGRSAGSEQGIRVPITKLKGDARKLPVTMKRPALTTRHDHGNGHRRPRSGR